MDISRTVKAGLFSALFLCFVVGPRAVSAGDSALSAEDFLRLARRPPSEKTWAILEGTAANKKAGKGVVRTKLRVAIRFTSEMMLARVAVGEKGEVYFVGQPYVGKGKASVFKEGAGDRLGAEFGVRPEDLTMSFLFWNFKKELDPDTVRTVGCRVFLLEAPDGKRRAKVYITEKQFFPLKVEWSKLDGEGEWKMERSLEARSFKKVNGLYLVDGLLFLGPGWRTQIDFAPCRAGLVSKGVPKGLFAPPAGGAVKDEEGNPADASERKR